MVPSTRAPPVRVDLCHRGAHVGVLCRPRALRHPPAGVHGAFAGLLRLHRRVGRPSVPGPAPHDVAAAGQHHRHAGDRLCPRAVSVAVGGHEHRGDHVHHSLGRPPWVRAGHEMYLRRRVHATSGASAASSDDPDATWPSLSTRASEASAVAPITSADDGPAQPATAACACTSAVRVATPTRWPHVAAGAPGVLRRPDTGRVSRVADCEAMPPPGVRRATVHHHFATSVPGIHQHALCE